MNKKLAVVILAAGKGKRMEHELPKVLVPVRGKPMIEHLFATLAKANFTEKPIVVVGHKKELIKKVLSKRARFVEQKRALGTGHAVRVTEKPLKGKADSVIVLYGDSPLVSTNTLKTLCRLQQRNRAAFSLLTFRVPDFKNLRRSFYAYGRIERDASGKYLKRCIEFKDATPKQKAIKEVNDGAYCFDARWLWKNLPKIKRRNASGEYYLTDLMGIAVEQGQRVIPFAPKNWQEGIGANTPSDIKSISLICNP